MNVGIVIGIICGVIAAALLVVSIRDLLVWCYKEGYQRGRYDERQAWFEQGRQVDQARQEIWREEGTKHGD